MNREEFVLEVGKLGIDLSEKQLLQLEKYYELLVEWNEKINLTAITDKEDVYLKHFYDSLTITKVIDLNNIESLCDIGTGAGFPGIVLKIAYPDLNITLVDALNKRINFLNEVITNLILENVTLVHARAEEYAKENRSKFDVVTARAVASLPVLLEYSLPIVKVNGCFIAYKGMEDISNSNNALNILNGKVEEKIEFKLPKEESERTLIKIKKLKEISNKYPRRFSEIKKKPL